jgi:gamma-glutamyltranspeptidase / glutathione hydrolase
VITRIFNWLSSGGRRWHMHSFVTSLNFRRAMLTVAIGCALLSFRATTAATATGQRGMVATVHPLATAAGVQTLQAGGNAIDAAVAAGLTLGVVDGYNSGIGGGCFILIRVASGETYYIDGREMAPAGAQRDMFIREGRADPQLSQTGPLAVAVPGALAAYEYAARWFGKFKLNQLLIPAAQIAEAGFPIPENYARRIEATAKELGQFPAARAIFLDTNGAPLAAGTMLKQPDLARTYRAIATRGTNWFYNGPFAQMVGAWMSTNGGVLRAGDFQRYRIRLREPVSSTYRGYTILGFPPPSSGWVHVAQILNILENFNLKQHGPNSPNTIHLITEAMKLAFADRAYWLGDPDYVNVPRSLVSKTYAAGLARRIRLDQATAVRTNGIPSGAPAGFFGKHTTHFCTADESGNWVACTATINTTFGSKVVVPGTGVVLNNEMDDFSAQPGTANFFGLVGAEANAIAPGKRPLSSMSPTLVYHDGRPLFSVGAAGGPTIITQVVLAIVNVIDFGMDIESALAQPRFHHQWLPDELRIESTIGEGVINELRKRGHKVTAVDSMGAAQAIALLPEGTGFFGVTDPRGVGQAQGW